MLYETKPQSQITFSTNRKLNTLLNHIADSLINMGMSEVKRYISEFKNEPDYNIVNYGNLLVYYADVRALYELSGYKSIRHWNDSKLWETYRRQVGYVARYLARLSWGFNG